MFQSAKGIYLMDRSLESIKYISDAVEAYNSYTVTSSKLITSLNQVRFTLSGGVVLVYDYFVDQWSVLIQSQLWTHVSLAAVHLA